MIFRRSDVRVSGLFWSIAIGLLSLLANEATAADQPRLYEVGGGFLAGGQLEAGGVYRENFFYESRGGESATGYRIHPSVSLIRNGSEFGLAFDAEVDHASFDLPGDLDSYLEYGGSGRLNWRPLTKHGFELSSAYTRGHDQPGLLRTEDGPEFGGEIDEWEQTRVGLNYRYGSPSSLASNDLSLGYRGREYVTNRDATQLLNYDAVQLGYGLAYAYSPKTSIVFNIGHSSTNYEVGTLPSGTRRDGNELTVRAGLRWVATGKTSGQVLVGARSYSVDGRGRPSREGFSWRANIDWAPLDTSTLRFSTSQSSSETFRGDTLFIDNHIYELSWRQVWTERLSTTLAGNYTDSEFVGSGRKDQTLNLSAGAAFVLMRTVSVFGEYYSRDRDSSLPNRDYDAPEVRVGLRWTP